MKAFKIIEGKYVIVRSYNEGINAGEVVEADATGVHLKDCRRLWRHWPADEATSWYEGVAISGLGSKSIVSAAVESKIIVEKYSITFTSPEAEKSIREFPVHEQS